VVNLAAELDSVEGWETYGRAERRGRETRAERVDHLTADGLDMTIAPLLPRKP
jgi:hypothetical protein